MSRRQILAAAGVVAGAGLVPAVAAAEQGASGRLVGVAPQGGTAAEFRARFAQTGETGEHFVGYGYLTAARGTTDADLFASAVHNDTTALLTAYAAGELVRRTVDQSVHSLDIEGTLTIYQRSAPGASFADPDSFRVGTPVARFAVTLQDIVTVFTAGRGLPTLNGDLLQTDAGQLSGGPGRMFGHPNLRARLFATGIGTLVDPVRLNSLLEMAGQWTT
jgi:hypothetical protein